MKNLLPRLLHLSVKTQILILALIVAIPAVGIIVYTGIKARDEAVRDASLETQHIAENIAAEQQNLVASAQQLIIALTQLPDVKKQNKNRVQTLLMDIRKLNPQYSNILIADRAGTVWAAAVPIEPTFNVSDRRYFQNAVASGQLSSGEYILSRSTTLPTFNLAYAFKDERGEVSGVIIVGFVLDFYKQALARSGLPSNASFILLDHKGAVLYRPIEPEKYIGKQYDPELFRNMQEGPDVYTYSGISTISGDLRILSYRKLRLPAERSPYMYIRVGVPIEGVLADANRTLYRNLALFSSFLLFAIIIAWFIGRYSIADRVTLLEGASQKLADGDLNVRISDLVAGGELGKLGQTFDLMAQKLKIREEALIESERNYRNIFNATKDAIFLHDPEAGKIIELNDTALELYGYSREEILDTGIHDLSSGESPYSMREAMEWMLKAVRQGPQNFEWLAKRKNGELFWTEVVLSATHIKGADFVLAVVRDISYRKQAEEEKQKLQAQLYQAQKMESIGHLAGGIAHDFNNVLAAIIGYGSVMQSKIGLNDPNRDCIDNILTSAERAANLTQSLLAFSRKQVISPRVIDLNECIRKTDKFLARIIGEDIILSTTLREGPLMIYADITQIEQILLNLATNARDAMPRGGRLVIETELVELEEGDIRTKGYETPGPCAVICISDTGEGMDKDTLNKMFEPFFTTKELGRGTGLGLAIVYGIVKQNNGHISVYSEPGSGTTFKIYFPLAGSDIADDTGPEVYGPIMGGTETILLAEDNEVLRLMNTSLLQEFGYTVIAAEDGEDALQKFARQQDCIDLLILDIVMPKKSGKEVFEEAIKINPRVKALFTSGYPVDLVEKQGALEKGLHFLPKPSPLNALLRKIREVLD
jgi:PAS domain S-box-containing protein